MSLNLEGKAAFVTGGGSGIGTAISEAMAGYGARVAVVDLNRDAAEAVAGRIVEAGGDAIALTCNVTDPTAVEKAVSMAYQHFGRLDCAANNAGGNKAIKDLVEISASEWEAEIALNLNSVYNCMHAQMKVMLAQGRGTIVNTASIWGTVAGAKYTGYTAAKHGVIGITKAAAIEAASKGVRVNAVCPGYIETPLTMSTGIKLEDDADRIAAVKALHPIGRLGKPGEVAEAVCWLSSDKSSFVVGHALAVDGGYVAW